MRNKQRREGGGMDMRAQETPLTSAAIQAHLCECFDAQGHGTLCQRRVLKS
jgi:hypothetical protein